MNELIQSALSNPSFTSIRITPTSVTFSTRKRRYLRGQIGDVKWMRGKRYVRRQVYNKFYQGWEVRRGRPVCHWVQEDSDKEKSPPANYKPGTIIPSPHYF